MPSTLNQWTYLSVPDTGVKALAAKDKDTLYGFGNTIVQRYSIQEDSWDTLATPPHASSIASHQVAVIGNLAYLHMNNGELWSFDMDDETWVQHATEVSEVGREPALTVINGKLWAIGGTDVLSQLGSGNNSAPWIREYDPATDTWSYVGDMIVVGYGSTPQNLSSAGTAVATTNGQYVFYYGGLQIRGPGNTDNYRHIIRWDVAKGEGEIFIDGSANPAVFNRTVGGVIFPHKTLGDVVMIGPSTYDAFSNPQPGKWQTFRIDSAASLSTIVPSGGTVPQGSDNSNASRSAAQVGGDYYCTFVDVPGGTEVKYFAVYGAYDVGDIRVPGGATYPEGNQIFPAPEKLPHIITVEDTQSLKLAKKLQDNFDSIERQLLALDPEQTGRDPRR